ncbi:DUF3301 domain-containing protein [Marinifaba aquimaris]|uniref:DUF3301 domain-containing protein n=1 Tax=Marinifaba aquimaris TaxID=2741323 RepID=UPI001C2CDE0E|nr:DUF3301 domain-containing protein [Marinifaba aquimaris]
MQLTDILTFAIVLAVVAQFWRLRQQAEIAVASAKHYCKQNQVQYIACARIKTQLKFFGKSLLYWQSTYLFEFSGNGEDKVKGELVLENSRVISIEAEAYRI